MVEPLSQVETLVNKLKRRLRQDEHDLAELERSNSDTKANLQQLTSNITGKVHLQEKLKIELEERNRKLEMLSREQDSLVKKKQKLVSQTRSFHPQRDSANTFV
jgi:chromosome segregation ATPase